MATSLLTAGSSALLVLLLAPAFAWAATFEWAIVGDGGDWNVRTRSVRDSIKKAGITQLILPGDNLYNTRLSYESVWNPWRDVGLQFDIVAIGNHTDGYRKERKYFGLKDAHYSKKPASNILFLILNSDDQYWEKLQMRWLDKQLAAAREEYIFLVYHHPSLDVSLGGHRWTERHQFQRLIRPLLVKYRDKLTAVLTGHDHIAAQLSFGTLPVIVSGATHDPTVREPMNNTQEGVKVTTEYFSKEYVPFWVKLILSDQKEGAEIQFVRASDNETRYTSCLLTGKPSVAGSCKDSSGPK